ncbi:threonine/serine dehydratase [Deinococcus cavernae]|uniref:Threonine/serine dehydratase n=1 Tax=Deinococcus cavernae TaxID=2320857 RepID=A0A418V7T5_9DEIO|nr:threonine/serine dehydratase [Deinococcus cavernae]RJF72141.1 threonine/serine dehydratase [Deinococcus cavernae]
MIELSDVQAAATRLEPHVHRTPVLTSRTLNAALGRKLLFKAEHLQKTGSFKVRGALNAALQLPAGTPGLVSLSSGNHAQGVAFAARVLGIPATIFMYDDSTDLKREAVRAYGAAVVESPRADGDIHAREYAAQHGFHFIHPYDDRHVMAGQGTQGLEFTQQVKDAPDAVLVAVGGGGMVSGIATVIKAVWPHTRVIGVEPALADDARQSLAAGKRVSLPAPPQTVADGVRSLSVGALTFPVMQARVDEIVTASEDSIRAAHRLMMQHLKQVVEPTAALPIAPLLEGKNLPERLGVFICGGNWLP